MSNSHFLKILPKLTARLTPTRYLPNLRLPCSSCAVICVEQRRSMRGHGGEVMRLEAAFFCAELGRGSVSDTPQNVPNNR